MLWFSQSMMVLCQFKNHAHVKKVEHNSEFMFGIYWWTWKQLFKKLLKWANKRSKNYNIYHVVFLKRKTHGDSIILHLCTKNLDDVIYSSWDIEWDRLKLVIMDHALPFYFSPLKKTLKKSEFWKNGKND